MDAIAKQLGKLTPKEQLWLKKHLVLLKAGQLSGLDIKKLKGRNDIFRMRVGSIRIIYRQAQLEIKILSVGRRNDNTYR